MICGDRVVYTDDDEFSQNELTVVPLADSIQFITYDNANDCIPVVNINDPAVMLEIATLLIQKANDVSWHYYG